MNFIKKIFSRRESKTPSIIDGLLLAIRNGDSYRIREILKNNSELIQYENNEGENLLHLAAECQSLSSVAELVDAGVDVEKKSKKGWNPEDIACFSGEFRMGCYTEICMKIRKRLSNPRTPKSEPVAAGQRR